MAQPNELSIISMPILRSTIAAVTILLPLPAIVIQEKVKRQVLKGRMSFYFGFLYFGTNGKMLISSNATKFWVARLNSVEPKHPVNA